MTYLVRTIRAGEWPQARDLRLRALQDELAPVAFTTTLAEALVRPDAYWREQARNSSPSAESTERPVRQFVATAGADWVGSATVLVHRRGDPSFWGARRQHDEGDLVAVWIDPAHRGRGLLEQLVGASSRWLADLAVPALQLWVYQANPRALAAYRRVGLTPTGQRWVDPVGPMIQLGISISRPLPPRAPIPGTPPPARTDADPRWRAEGLR